MQLQARAARAAGQPAPVEFEKEFIIGGLDLISGLAEGLGPAIEPMVARVPMTSILLQCGQVRFPPQKKK